MVLEVRPMTLAETELRIDYFHNSTPEHLEMLGVDPTRLPTREAWRQFYQRQFTMPIEQREDFQTVWLSDGLPIGFSTVGKIAFGEQAYMHLHIIDPGQRNSGMGSECVRLSAGIYFGTLKLKRLYCEPNAFNVAPNRTLQKAGFKYMKTYMTVPSAMNYHQAVTRWVLERGCLMANPE